MKCQLCNREAEWRKTKAGGKDGYSSETFFSLSWKHIDKEEYELRKKDGRALILSEVCPGCIELHTGRPPLGLWDYNEIRRRGITKDQYYQERGY